MLFRVPAAPYPDRMIAPADELHVWRARLDAGWPAADRLPAAERDRAARALRAPARRRWVAARWALRTVLGRYLEQEPERVELRAGSGGKPLLAAPDAALRFNLSHSGGLALVAVATGSEVGVDVERIEPRRDSVALARRALRPAEAARIEACPSGSRPAAFHSAWTRHEAVAKCFGGGLGAPLPEGPAAVADLDLGPGYAAAVAVAGDAVPPLRQLAIDPASAATAVPGRR